MNLRLQALANNQARYFDGKPCRHGHVAERYSKRGECVVCRHQRVQNWRERNPDRHIYYANVWRDKNPERARRNSVQTTAQRRARQCMATPAWVDQGALRHIYQECPKGMDVDHIIPLSSQVVCGLHVPWNLQYLEPRVNKRKSNRLKWVS